MRVETLAPLIGGLFLSACTSQPVVRVQYVNIPTYIPIPVTLTQPISVDLTGDTWGKAVGDLKAGLEACEAQTQGIRGLTPPPPRGL